MRIKIKDKIIIPIKIFGHPYLIFPTVSSNPSDEQAFIDTCLGFPNERLSRNLVLPILNENDIFVDVGAMIGSWSLPAAALGARVMAVEPNEFDTWILENQRNLNGFNNKMIIVNDKITNKHNERLDYILNTLDADKCKLIKIDVEGKEFDVLLSARETIHSYLPSLLVELHNGGIESYLEWFDSNISSDYRHFVMDQRINSDSAECYHIYHHI